MVPDNERSGLGVAPLEDNSLGEGEGGLPPTFQTSLPSSPSKISISHYPSPQPSRFSPSSISHGESISHEELPSILQASQFFQPTGPSFLHQSSSSGVKLSTQTITSADVDPSASPSGIDSDTEVGDTDHQSSNPEDVPVSQVFREGLSVLDL